MDLADQRLRDGDLEGARAALVEAVRSEPAEPTARMFLFQLLCLFGEWDKARRHLEALAQLSPEARVLSVAYGLAIDAESARADVFAGRALAPVLAGGDWANGVALALQHCARGESVEAAAARDAALELAPDTPGEIDGARFEWISDADARFGPCFEAIIGGRYGFVAFDAVEKIVSEGPRDLRDLVWYPAEITLRQGMSSGALLPVRYPGTEQSSDAAERLGRATRWKNESWGEAGSGQHLWTLSSQDDRGILALRTLTFD